MPTNRRVSDLPKGSGANGDAWMPDAEPVFAKVIADSLQAAREAREPKVRDYVRPSDALKCARQIGYISAGTPPDSAEMDASSLLTFAIGDFVEGLTIDAIVAAEPTAQTQVPFEVILCDTDIHGIADLVTEDAVWDCKTQGGYGWQRMIGVSGQAEGPKMSAVIQAGMGAIAMNRTEVGVFYVAKEPVSVQKAQKAGLDDMGRLYAEYRKPLAELEPVIDAEITRMGKANKLTLEGELPKRIIPGVPGEITDPEKGAWVAHNAAREITDAGTTWQCLYCDFQATCTKDGPGRVPIEITRN